MKIAILTTLLMLSSIALNAQEKKFEHNIYLSVGYFMDKTSGDNESGLSTKIGYGLNCYLSEKISIMPGLAIRQLADKPFSNDEGADYDSYTFLDVPVIMQYHIQDQNNKWVLGLGPVFSFCIQNDQYYYDANPNAATSDKIKNFNLCLQPSIMYQTGKFRIGIEANAGLLNVAKTNNYSSGSKYLHDIVASVYFHF